MEKLSFLNNLRKNKYIGKFLSGILLLISVGILLYFCIANDNLKKILNILPSLNSWWLVGAGVCMLLSWFLDSLIIRETVNLSSEQKISRFYAFKVTMTGQYFTSLIPFGLGGQAVQTTQLCDKKISKTTAALVVLRKFLIYQSTLSGYSLIIFLIMLPQIKHRSYVIIACLCSGIAFQCFTIIILLIFCVNKKLVLTPTNYILRFASRLKIIKNPKRTFSVCEKRLDFLVNANKVLNKKKKANLVLYTCTFLQLSLLFAVPFFVFKSFHHTDFCVWEIISTQCMVNAVSSFTPLPGSAGTAEESFIVFFKNFFYQNELVAAMIICRFLTFYSSIILGFLFYKIKTKR